MFNKDEIEFLQKTISEENYDFLVESFATLNYCIRDICYELRKSIFTMDMDYLVNEYAPHIKYFEELNKEIEKELFEFPNVKPYEQITTDDFSVLDNDNPTVITDTNKEFIRYYGLDSDFLYKKPQSFSYEGITYPIKFWKDMLMKMADILYSKDPVLFESFTDNNKFKGTRRTYVAKNTDYIQKPYCITGSDSIYIETNFQANDICRILIYMLEEYRIPIESVQIRIVEGFRKKHRKINKNKVSETDTDTEDAEGTDDSTEDTIEDTIDITDTIDDGVLVPMVGLPKTIKRTQLPRNQYIVLNNENRDKFHYPFMVVDDSELKDCEQCHKETEPYSVAICGEYKNKMYTNNAIVYVCPKCGKIYISESEYKSKMKREYKNLKYQFQRTEI